MAVGEELSFLLNGEVQHSLYYCFWMQLMTVSINCCIGHTPVSWTSETHASKGHKTTLISVFLPDSVSDPYSCISKF